MTINTQTPHLGLPLPHPANTLEADVLRLREALQKLDAHLSNIDALLAIESGEDLDTLREIVDAVKLAHEDIGALNALIETEVRSVVADLRDEMDVLRPLIYAGL